MKQQIKDLFADALARLAADRPLPGDGLPDVQVERVRDRRHGDFSSNAALVLAKQARAKPRDLAARLVAALPPSRLIERVEIAGPGFINVFLSPSAYRALVPQILAAGPAYGRSDLGTGKRVQVEFVSANPTGPLHVGHGRGAAYGAVVANLLAAVGFAVHREYYVNDAGRQMDILATSVWLRYLELCGETLSFPSNGYQGDYVWDIAATLHREQGDDYRYAGDEVFAGLPPDEPAGGDKETHTDALIERALPFVEVPGRAQALDGLVDDTALSQGMLGEPLVVVHPEPGQIISDVVQDMIKPPLEHQPVAIVSQ